MDNSLLWEYLEKEWKRNIMCPPYFFLRINSCILAIYIPLTLGKQQCWRQRKTWLTELVIRMLDGDLTDVQGGQLVANSMRIHHFYNSNATKFHAISSSILRKVFCSMKKQIFNFQYTTKFRKKKMSYFAAIIVPTCTIKSLILDTPNHKI